MTIKSYGQCGREYPSGFYHNSKFVNAQGDTLNKLDNSGLYEGLHLYTDNADNLYTDTNSFVIGNFHHGQPVGDWKDHCKDSSFSIGQFSCGGGESSSDGKGGWVTKHQGIYVKIGVWKYYDPYGKLNLVGNYVMGKRDGRWLGGDLSKTKYLGDICLNPNLPNLEEEIKYRENLLDIIITNYQLGKALNKEFYDVNMNNYSDEEEVEEGEIIEEE